MKSKTTKLNEVASGIGMNVNEKKTKAETYNTIYYMSLTKVMTVNNNSTKPFTLGNNIIEEVEDFKYHGSILSNNSNQSQN